MSDAPSLRETIEAAMSAEAEPAPAPDAVETPEAPVEAAPEPTASPEKPARARSEDGRFAKNTEKPEAAPAGAQRATKGEVAAAGKGKADGAPTPPAPSAEPASPVAPPVKAPQAWSASEREHYAKASPELRAAIDRREREITRTLSQTAEARRTSETVHRTLAPFEGLARANGMDALSYAGSVMQTAAQLFQGPPQTRAAILASLIQQAGLTDQGGLEAINAALTNPQAAPSQAPSPQADIDAIVERKWQEREQAAQARSNHDAAQAFLETKPEFIDDVMPDMVEILRLDRSRGGNMTPQQAYDRAVKFNEGVQSVLAQRKAAEAARANAPTVQRSKAAAVSVKPSPVAAQPRSTGTPSLRETIEAAVAGQRIG